MCMSDREDFGQSPQIEPFEIGFSEIIDGVVNIETVDVNTASLTIFP